MNDPTRRNTSRGGRPFPQRLVVQQPPQQQPVHHPTAPQLQRERYEPSISGAITSGRVQRRDAFEYDPRNGLVFLDRNTVGQRVVPVPTEEIMGVRVDEGPFHTTFTLELAHQEMVSRGLTRAASDALLGRVLSLIPGEQGQVQRLRASPVGAFQGLPPVVTLTPKVLVVDDRHMPGLTSTRQVFPLYLIRSVQVRAGLRDGVLFARLEFSVVQRDEPLVLRGFNPEESLKLGGTFLGGSVRSRATGQAVLNGRLFPTHLTLTDHGVAVRTTELTEETTEFIRMPFIRSMELLSNFGQGVVGAGVRITLNDRPPIDIGGIPPEAASNIVDWFRYLRSHTPPTGVGTPGTDHLG